MQKSHPGNPKGDVVIAETFRDDLRYWAENDRKLLLRLLDLMEAIVGEPFTGIGKPEPLKYEISGAWSRRLDKKDRIVYKVGDDLIEFLQARYHY
ncbi:MAG: Txe/YoeB family addiction module toxin [bacterium]|nr:Txe/YoeB family addiction module toxin [bacterium]